MNFQGFCKILKIFCDEDVKLSKNKKLADSFGPKKLSFLKNITNGFQNFKLIIPRISKLLITPQTLCAFYCLFQIPKKIHHKTSR